MARKIRSPWLSFRGIQKYFRRHVPDSFWDLDVGWTCKRREQGVRRFAKRRFHGCLRCEDRRVAREELEQAQGETGKDNGQ